MLYLVNLLAGGVANSDPSGDISKLVETIKGVGNTIVYVIYALLGTLLIVKGAILGMQIVKAADEPQVRQEKIGSLKWLIIGIAIAYGVSALAQILINVIANSIGNSGK